jgi:Cutinase
MSNLTRAAVCFLSATAMVMAAIGAPAATAQAAPICSDVVVVGVHGTGEGPNTFDPSAYSPTLRTVESGAKPVLDSAGVRYDFAGVVYDAPRVDNLSAFFTYKLDTLGAINAINERLGRYKNCPRPPNVVLSGYSLGAWSVLEWLSQQKTLSKHRGKHRAPNYLQQVKGVAIFGDPQFNWEEKLDPPGVIVTHKGLAQYTPWAIKGPYPPVLPGGVGIQSWCAQMDPICGVGYTLPVIDISSPQVQDAKNCSEGNGCPHMSYAHEGGPATGAGKWLAEQALKK